MLVTVSGDHQVALQVQGDSPPGGTSLMDQSWTGKTWDYTPMNVFCFCCAFICLLHLSFSGIWHSVNGYGEMLTAYNVVCLSHEKIPFYWAILICGLSRRWFLPKVYCLIDIIIITNTQFWGRKVNIRKCDRAKAYVWQHSCWAIPGPAPEC